MLFQPRKRQEGVRMANRDKPKEKKKLKKSKNEKKKEARDKRAKS
jgi:hypothetical protein